MPSWSPCARNCSRIESNPGFVLVRSSRQPGERAEKKKKRPSRWGRVGDQFTSPTADEKPIMGQQTAQSAVRSPQSAPMRQGRPPETTHVPPRPCGGGGDKTTPLLLHRSGVPAVRSWRERCPQIPGLRSRDLSAMVLRHKTCESEEYLQTFGADVWGAYVPGQGGFGKASRE